MPKTDLNLMEVKANAVQINGQVYQKVASPLRKAVIGKYFNEEWEQVDNRTFLMPIAKDVNDVVIYAKVEVSITANTEFTSSKKAKAEPEIVIIGELR